MKNFRKLICIFGAVAALIATCLVMVACNGVEPVVEGDKYTITFETNGGSAIDPIVAAEGATITPPADPAKDGYRFGGWYRYSDLSGDAAELPTVMPGKNTTFYAKWTDPGDYHITYMFNLDKVEHTGAVTPTYGDEGDTVKVNDGAAYAATGYYFMGWSTSANGKVSVSGIKENGQYLAGDDLTFTANDVTLFAQWAEEYTDVDSTGRGKVYIYEPAVNRGLGGAVLVRGNEAKYGFVSRPEGEFGFTEFEFMFDASEGGTVKGRLYDGKNFQFCDGYDGTWLYYDHRYGEYQTRILATDGYGSATITEVVGDITSVEVYGYYEYDSEYNDFALYELDPLTGQPVLDDEDKPIAYYFMLDRMEIEDTEFDGEFRMLCNESGTFVLYMNGELYDECLLMLNGYGYGIMYEYNDATEDYEIAATGEYVGTVDYVNAMGEWEFFIDDEFAAVYDGFRFILTYIDAGEDSLAVYIEYSEILNLSFEDASGNGDTLYLDGYGGAIYTAAGASYEGNCTITSTLVTFVPYVDDGQGGYVACAKMYFNIDMLEGTFTVNDTGFGFSDKTITSYEGTSQIVTIPETISGVLVTAIGENAFNYAQSPNHVSLISVTIPATVTSIGACAFENDHTLRRAIFLSDTPIDIDWAAAKDPFRWPAGNFIIVVPEDAKAAYVAAWTGCTYPIKGSVEVNTLPEFEVDGSGVLVAYNGEAEEGELLDVVLPDDVTGIADGVFRGLDFIRSIDLKNVTEIGEDAFFGCTQLVTVTATELETVGAGAFMSCEALAAIALPKVKTVGDSAFNGCYALKSVTLGPDLESIGDQAFVECHIYKNTPPLFIQLQGTTPPEMGVKVTAGNISIKIVVPDVNTALACYDAADWRQYVRHLYVESGAEKGMYMDGLETLELDGRAVLFSTYPLIYAINGTTFTMYEYDVETGTYTPYIGTYENDTVTVTIGARTYNFVKVTGSRSYTSADSKFTLVCDPRTLLPDAYADTDYVGYADATLNGAAVRVHVMSYQTRIIHGYRGDDGVTYDIYISLDSDTLVYTLQPTAYYIKNITAADGSVLNLHVTASITYIYGSLKIEVAPGVMLPDCSDYSVSATQVSDTVYTFYRYYSNGNTYFITVTFSSDFTTFTYTYEVQS